jgi:hypothetical protein
MSLADLLAAVGRAIMKFGGAERRRCCKAQAELMALDDHMLADIGLRRAQIAEIAHRDAEERQARGPAASAMQSRPARHRPA